MAHSDHPLAVGLSGGEVPGAELCDRMPQPIIHRTTSALAAVQVGDRNAQQMGRRRCGKGLVAIAQEDQQLGLQALQRLANPRQGLSAQRCHRRRGGGLQAERHQGGGMEPISVNLSHGAAMPLAEVAAAHDQLHGQAGICINRRDQMAQQAVFRPAAGEHGDAAHSRVLSHQSGHRPDSCVEPGGPTRADNASG